MTQILKIIPIIATILLAGCGDKKSRDFFAAKGITVGTPVSIGKRSYRIPVDFETDGPYSAQWIDTVVTSVDATDILVTAVFTHSNRSGRYPGYIEISGVSTGTYDLKYRDPDGTRHRVGPVELP